MIFKNSKKGVIIALASCMVVVGFGFMTFTLGADNTSFVRGMYGSSAPGTLWNKFQSLGFNTVTVGAYKASLDNLAARGMRGIVWLGDYSKSSCVFDHNDATIRSMVTPIAGHPAILQYELAQEPEYALEHCPNVVNQMKARSNLVKSIDPSKPTYIVLSHQARIPGGALEMYPYHYFIGSADNIGLDVYPCHLSKTTCDFSDIDKAIAAANTQGIPHYYAVLQDFYDPVSWRLPTATDLQTEFDHWATSRMEGYLIYIWSSHGVSLDSHPEHYPIFQLENARDFGNQTPPSPPTGLKLK